MDCEEGRALRRSGSSCSRTQARTTLLQAESCFAESCQAERLFVNPFGRCEFILCDALGEPV